MAARQKRGLSERQREKIKVGLLLKRLEDNALGKLIPEMTPGQIRSAETCLRKAMPDLQSVEHTGDLDTNITITWEK